MIKQIIFFSFLTCPVFGQTWIMEPFSNSKQVLLTNNAKFKSGGVLKGASAFLMDLDGKTVAVTVKHLLGEDGGVTPSIVPSKLDKDLISWELYSRYESKDTLHFEKNLSKNDDPKIDIIAFTIKESVTDYLKLKPRYTIPMSNEKFYLIGCPYSEKNCKQNKYELPFNFYNKADGYSPVPILGLSMWDYEKVDFSGFSGAPVVDKNGDVIGVLTGRMGLVFTVIPVSVLKGR